MEGRRSHSFLLAVSKIALLEVSIFLDFLGANFNFYLFREYNRAMKTAMRLIEYEKELSTKEVYSIVAIACFFN